MANGSLPIYLLDNKGNQLMSSSIWCISLRIILELELGLKLFIPDHCCLQFAPGEQVEWGIIELLKERIDFMNSNSNNLFIVLAYRVNWCSIALQMIMINCSVHTHLIDPTKQPKRLSQTNLKPEGVGWSYKALMLLHCHGDCLVVLLYNWCTAVSPLHLFAFNFIIKW